MRIWFVALAAVIEFPLMAAHQVFPSIPYLPLGGSEFIQHTILIAVGLSLAEISAFTTESVRLVFRTIRRGKKGRDE